MLNIALLGSSGYIAEYLIEKLEKEKEIEKILRIGRTDLADIYLELQEAENFPYDILRDIDYIIFTAAISGPDQCASEIPTCLSKAPVIELQVHMFLFLAFKILDSF